MRQQDGHLLEEMLNDGISEERLVYILGQSLPRIIPNVILNKREVCILRMKEYFITFFYDS